MLDGLDSRFRRPPSRTKVTASGDLKSVVHRLQRLLKRNQPFRHATSRNRTAVEFSEFFAFVPIFFVPVVFLDGHDISYQRLGVTFFVCTFCPTIYATATAKSLRRCPALLLSILPARTVSTAQVPPPKWATKRLFEVPPARRIVRTQPSKETTLSVDNVR